MDTTETAEHEAMIDAKLAELREKYPDADVFETAGRPELTVIVRPPNPHEWKHAKSLIYEKTTRADGNRQLVNDCLLFPDPKGADFLRLAQRYAAWVDNLAGAIGDLAGTNFEVSIRKR